MNKLIISLLLTTTFTQHLTAMKRPRPQSLEEAMMINCSQNPNFEQNFVNTIISQRNQCGIMSRVDENYVQMRFKPLEELWKKLPWDLTKKILSDHFTDTFTTRDTPATVEKHITTMSSLHNKEIATHVHSPQTTFTILRTICGTLHPRLLAERINTPGMRAYLALDSSQ